MFIKLDLENINTQELFLIITIDIITKIETPFFISENQKFAVNYFESWKSENNEITKFCKIIKLPLIIERIKHGN